MGTHQHCSPADATCCQSLLLDPDATIGIDLRKRLFLLVTGRGEYARIFLTMDALCRLTGDGAFLNRACLYRKALDEAQLKCRSGARRAGTGGEATSCRIIGQVVAASTGFFRLVRGITGTNRSALGRRPSIEGRWPWTYRYVSDDNLERSTGQLVRFSVQNSSEI